MSAAGSFTVRGIVVTDFENQPLALSGSGTWSPGGYRGWSTLIRLM